MARCAFFDPFCPCQDGDACHYEYTGRSPAIAPQEEVARFIRQLLRVRPLLAAVSKAQGEQRDCIGDSDLYDEQPISLTVSMRLGDARLVGSLEGWAASLERDADALAAKFAGKAS